VLNFGVPGDNTPEHAVLLERKVLRLGPDFVLVQWFVNDVEGGSTEGRPSYWPLMPWPALHNRLYESSALYTLLNTWWGRWQAESRMAGSYPDYIWRRLGNPQGEDAQRDREAMRKLVALCRRHGVPVGFVLFPDSGFDPGPDYPFTYLHDRVLEFCQAEQIRCVDLRPEFTKVKDRYTLWVNPLDRHPSAQANTIAAVTILQTFEEVWRQRLPARN